MATASETKLKESHVIPPTDALKDKARKALQDAISADPSKSQADFARKLGMSPGSVSKILINDHSHPMSIRFAQGLAAYIGRSLDEIFGSNSVYQYLSDDNDDAKSEASQEVFDESLNKLANYIDGFNFQVRRRRLTELAELVATEVEKTTRSPDDYQRVIMKIMAKEAMKG